MSLSNGRLRDELLHGCQSDSVLEVRVLIEDWRIDYNANRPHSALAPTEYATIRRDQINPNPHSG